MKRKLLTFILLIVFFVPHLALADGPNLTGDLQMNTDHPTLSNGEIKNSDWDNGSSGTGGDEIKPPHQDGPNSPDVPWWKRVWHKIKETAADVWDGMKKGAEDAWDFIKDVADNPVVKTIVKAIAAIVVTAVVIVAVVIVLAAVGIELAAGLVIGAIVFAAGGIILSAIQGEDSFMGMLAEGLSWGLTTLAGLGALKALKFLKFLPASGFLGFLSKGVMSGIGTALFGIIRGGLHYLLTGDATLWHEAFSWDTLATTFAFGFIMGPLAERIFGRVALSGALNRPGRWALSLLTKGFKMGKDKAGQLAQRVSHVWEGAKAALKFGSANGAFTMITDTVSQWFKGGHIDWKSALKKSVTTIAIVSLFSWGALTFTPKLNIGEAETTGAQVAKTEINQTSREIAASFEFKKNPVENVLKVSDDYLSKIKNEQIDDNLPAVRIKPEDLKNYSIERFEKNGKIKRYALDFNPEDNFAKNNSVIGDAAHKGQVNIKNYPGDKDYDFNMIDNPGPLANQYFYKGSADTFQSGKYNIEVLTKDTVLYRAGFFDPYDPLSHFGSFYTTKPPSSEAIPRIDYAVKRYWLTSDGRYTGGTSLITGYYGIKFPKGTIIFRGPTGYQNEIHSGGREQIFIPQSYAVDGASVLEMVPFNKQFVPGKLKYILKSPNK